MSQIKISFGKKESRHIFIEDPREAFKKYNELFDEYGDNNARERLLNKVFIDNKIECENDEDVYDYIYLKVTLLNSFYGTLIKTNKLKDVAQRIYDNKLKLSELMNSESYDDRADAVNLIWEEKEDDDVGNIYSFATKYCSWHYPDKFPIVDSYVLGFLYRLNCQGYKDKNNYTFCDKFTQGELKDYKRFIEIYNKFREYIFGEINKKISYKEIDKFIWMYVVSRFKIEIDDFDNYIEIDILKDDKLKDKWNILQGEMKKKKEKTGKELADEEVSVIKKKFIQNEYLEKFKVSL